MDFDAVVEELYRLDPSEFVDVRDQRVREARQAGDRSRAAAIKALRRPSSAAWVVNRLARQRADEIHRLVELGDRLREAQASLSADDIRTLGQQRRQVVAALTREGARLADDLGQPISDAVEREVANTLEAAIADPVSAAAVQSGRLVRSLTYAGIGPDDLGGALAVAQPAEGIAQDSTEEDPGDSEPDAVHRLAIEAARHEASMAAGRVAEAVEAQTRASDSHRRATEQARLAVERAQQMEHELARARSSADELTAVARAAELAEAQALESVREARRQADEARARLDALLPPPGV
jgi:hypothetical protein